MLTTSDFRSAQNAVSGPEGPVLLRADAKSPISVNGQPVDEKILLQPGDEIQLGAVNLILHETPDRHLRRRLYGVLNELSERQKIVGELELAEPAAKILQYHWEMLRLRWIEHVRSEQHAMSSESSMIQQIAPADLH